MKVTRSTIGNKWLTHKLDPEKQQQVFKDFLNNMGLGKDQEYKKKIK